MTINPNQNKQRIKNCFTQITLNPKNRQSNHNPKRNTHPKDEKEVGMQTEEPPDG
jgi:hypothetical protein